MLKLAREIGVDRGNFSRMETGRANVPPALLRQIADILGCPLSFIEAPRCVVCREVVDQGQDDRTDTDAA